MNKNKTVKERDQYVVKSNDLVRKARYNLTMQQQHILLYCISKIKPFDPDNKWYTVNITDLCKTCNIEEGKEISGYYYKSIKRDFLKLTERFFIDRGDYEETVSFLSDVKINKFDGAIEYNFHNSIAPHLFGLMKDYTQYKLIDVLRLKGKYSIRLYEIIISFLRKTKISNGLDDVIQIPMDLLKKSLLLTEKQTRDIMKIINNSIKEINSTSETIHIEMIKEKKGVQITSIILYINNSNRIQKLIAKQNNVNNGLITSPSK